MAHGHQIMRTKTPGADWATRRAPGDLRAHQIWSGRATGKKGSNDGETNMRTRQERQGEIGWVQGIDAGTASEGAKKDEKRRLMDKVARAELIQPHKPSDLEKDCSGLRRDEYGNWGRG